MIDGTYDFEMDTSLGKKRGKITLQTEGNKVIANTDAPIIGKQHNEGTIEGNTFTLNGEFKILLSKVSYSLNGKVEGDTLTATIESSKGNFELKGTRI